MEVIMTNPSSADEPICRNCNTKLTEQTQRCPACGVLTKLGESNMGTAESAMPTEVKGVELEGLDEALDIYDLFNEANAPKTARANFKGMLSNIVEPLTTKAVIAATQTWIDELKGTSTHGNCCTCTTCKNYHDDCTCEIRDFLIAKLEQLNKGVK